MILMPYVNNLRVVFLNFFKFIICFSFRPPLQFLFEKNKNAYYNHFRNNPHDV